MMKRNVLIGMMAMGVLLLSAGCSKKAESASAMNDMFVNMNTVDYEGNKVTSEVFKENELTVINTWATWCGPCVGELPELNQLSEELKEEGIPVEIKGMVIEDDEKGINAGLSEEERKNVQEVLDSTGITYQQLLVSDELAKSPLKDQPGFPTTYFVDKNGKLVGEPVMFSQDKEGWKKVIMERLEEVKSE